MTFLIDDYEALASALGKMCEFLRGEEVPEETVFSSRLVANELLTNVLQHGGGSARFRFRMAGGEFLLCVKGENAYRPPAKSSSVPAEAESGRGLFLVDAYCERREYSETDGILVYIKL